MGHFESLYETLRTDKAALEAKLQKDCQLPEDVRLSIGEQTQLYMEWGYVYSLAETASRRLKYEWQEEAQPKCREWAEDELKATKGKPTVTAIADKATTYKMWSEKREEYLQAEQFALVAKHAVEAMRHRLFMIQSLNSRQKAELQTYPQEGN